jgi:hypothetical protein
MSGTNCVPDMLLFWELTMLKKRGLEASFFELTAAHYFPMMMMPFSFRSLDGAH